MKVWKNQRTNLIWRSSSAKNNSLRKPCHTMHIRSATLIALPSSTVPTPSDQSTLIRIRNQRTSFVSDVQIKSRDGKERTGWEGTSGWWSWFLRISLAKVLQERRVAPLMVPESHHLQGSSQPITRRTYATRRSHDLLAPPAPPRGAWPKPRRPPPLAPPATGRSEREMEGEEKGKSASADLRFWGGEGRYLDFGERGDGDIGILDSSSAGLARRRSATIFLVLL